MTGPSNEYNGYDEAGYIDLTLDECWWVTPESEVLQFIFEQFGGNEL